MTISTNSNNVSRKRRKGTILKYDINTKTDAQILKYYFSSNWPLDAAKIVNLKIQTAKKNLQEGGKFTFVIFLTSM